MKKKVLDILMSAKGYVSGETLSRELGVSRTAVWKAINRLKEEGYEISSVRNKGYLMIQETTELIEDALRMHLPPNSRFEKVVVYNTIDSTNSAAKRLWQEGQREEAILVSREQTAGKGRRGKSWLSPKDDGIFLSMLLTPDIEPTQASMLTLIAGMAVVTAIEKMTQLTPMIKWPNDIVLEQKKVSGILTEMSAEMDFVHYVVVGIGINVNQEIFDESISDVATSIKKVHGKALSRPMLIGNIIDAFETMYETFLSTRNLDFLMVDYNEKCININRALKVVTRAGEIQGNGVTVLGDGTLQIRLTDGTITSVNAGEVSVRGLYGYV